MLFDNLRKYWADSAVWADAGALTVRGAWLTRSAVARPLLLWSVKDFARLFGIQKMAKCEEQTTYATRNSKNPYREQGRGAESGTVECGLDRVGKPTDEEVHAVF